MPHTQEDPTIHAGLRLYNGASHDTVVERVAYGGFGVIAFGRNRLDNGEMVAYKTLRRELLNDPNAYAGFVRECLLWIGLWTHPNIASVRSVVRIGDAEGQRPFIALYYAENGSLRDLLRAAARQAPGRLPLDLGMSLAQQIAAGLTYLHTPDHAYLRDEPTVHRDLKPENVLLMGDGRAAITDFGLAKIVEDAAPETLATLAALLAGAAGESPTARATQTAGLHTANGMAMGTMAYMPPEQWQDARHTSTPADIYALGLILSELLAGRHALLDLDQPHSQADWERAHTYPTPRMLRAVEPGVPAVVETLYLRCLAADPAARPGAAEVLATLQAGARAAGLEPYEPWELARHTPYNEFVHWYEWSDAYYSFERYEEALTRNDRALTLARKQAAERPDLVPATLTNRADIYRRLGEQAAKKGDQAGATRWDAQAEVAYQESLNAYPPEGTDEGRKGRSMVWHQIGVFRNERSRWREADFAYAHALTLKTDMADTYFARAKNMLEWGIEDEQAQRRAQAIDHFRLARVYAVTSLGLSYPTARMLLGLIEEALQSVGAG